MYNSVSNELNRLSNKERELISLLAIAVKKLGGTLEISSEDMEEMRYANPNILSYIDEKTGGKIIKVR